MDLRNYEFRIYPSRKQISRLQTQFFLATKLYNLLLNVKKETYLANGKTLTGYDLNKDIKYFRDTDTEFKGMHSQVLQNVSDRLSKAYANFFRRVKERKAGKKVKVGFPRYKKWLKSITYPQHGFKFVSDKKLHISKIGNVPIVLHRLPRGKVKTMTIKRTKSGKWFVVFSCEIEPYSDTNSRPVNDKIVGVDVGINTFADLYDGTDEIKIENPRCLIKSERRLKRLQRQVSRKLKGSNNRKKAVHKFAIQHELVANQRKDFLHKTSRFLADNYGVVGVEGLNINGMLKNHCLAKHIADASWGAFLRMDAYKVVETGGQFIVGDPFEPTTQKCSKCGAMVSKSLADRIHDCPICGLKISRDLNSAINIRNIAKKNRVGRTRIHACGDSASTSRLERDASGVVEAGTKCG